MNTLKYHASKAQTAAFFDVSLPTVEAWIRRGMPVVQEGRSGVAWIIDLSAAARWLIARTASPESQHPPDHPDFDPEQLPPKERLDWFKSESERRKLQVADKELIPAAEVEIEVAALVKSFIGTLDTLPDVLERDAGITGAAAEVARRVIDAERDRLYERLSR